MDVDKIIAGLSEAGKRLLHALPTDPNEAAHFWNGEYRKFRGALRTYRRLPRIGLVSVGGYVNQRGLAVRAHLLEQEEG